MEIVRLVHTMKEVSRRALRDGSKIGFVPTMGFLHEGHLSLIRRVKEFSDIVVVSVFVNPTQFGPDEDLERYPRNLARDVDLCVAEGVDYLFTPEVEEIYPAGHRTFVEVEELSDVLEGVSRPGHFRGVATVVLKLFEIVRPTVAAFGQKDAQQAIVIQRMVRDLMLDVEVLVLPIVRDEDRLALSSRNKYLSDEQRAAAGAIPRALEAAQHVVAEGQDRPDEIVAAAREVLEAEPLLQVDYIELVDTDTMEKIDVLRGEKLLVLAVWAGKTRLLDNVMLRAPSRESR